MIQQKMIIKENKGRHRVLVMDTKTSIRNLLSTATIRETELWSSAFDPILAVLFSEPDRNTFLRWTNVVPEEVSWGSTLGYGEAKIAEPNPNIGGLVNDLLRLASMTTKAIGESKMRSILAFQIHVFPHFFEHQLVTELQLDIFM
ncbi:hypothetical protein BDF21DRAFT_452657 [Thamnidium elegans]|nr:hypothetical protein BDF21DRAFT_452657 [Thamnidium elegans]